MTTTQKRGPIESKLAAVGARIDRFTSPIGRVIKGELNLARRGVDETQVQVALGKMEARDQLEEARQRVRHAFAALDREVRALDDMPWDDLQREIHIEAVEVERNLTANA